jgi:O-antigen/teichoic acid export membrane protein
LNLLKVKGRSDLFLKLEIIKKILGVSMLIATVPLGLIVMCYSTIVNSLIALIINTYYTGKLINVGFVQQMRDLSFTLLLSLSMFAVVYGSTLFFNNHYLQLTAGLIIGVIYFTIVCFILKPQEILFVKSILKRKE